MINVHRLNGKEFVVNCELIKYVESTPDTMITLADNEKIMVQESVRDIISATIKYKQELFAGPMIKEGRGGVYERQSKLGLPTTHAGDEVK